jgi:hypothetical protein
VTCQATEPRGQLSYRSSLAAIDLARLRVRSYRSRGRVELSAADTEVLVGVLRKAADRAATRVAAAARSAVGIGADPESVGAVVHRILTRSRFFKGSRFSFDRATAVALVREQVVDGAPIRLMVRGFPFKQWDNGLKAAGPGADLADLAAVLRLWELAAAIQGCYPPGVRLWIRRDGDYYRPRPQADLDTYGDGLGALCALAGLADFGSWYDDRTLLASLLGTDRAAKRRRLIAEFTETIGEVVGPVADRLDAVAAGDRIERAFRASPEVVAIPRFDRIFRSLLFSLPVPTASGPDHMDLARRVLADVHGVRDAAVSDRIRDIRRSLRSRAWQESIGYLAVLLADERIGAWDSLPPHIRLVNNTGDRYGMPGISYLGGSPLLPWHGTGCVDHKGQVSVDFLAVQVDRGFVPVMSEVTGPDQPLLMVPPDLVSADGAGLVSQFYEQVRMRSR